MHFQFVTKYNRDHCHLEDFQPHRRIFGVSWLCAILPLNFESWHAEADTCIGHWYHGLSRMEG